MRPREGRLRLWGSPVRLSFLLVSLGARSLNVGMPAKNNCTMSRRHFLAASSSAIVAGALAQTEKQTLETAPKLALHGGEKAVKQPAKLPIRWGEPERERLNTMLGQDSLFYWKGPQTTLLIERFKKGLVSKICGLTPALVADRVCDTRRFP